MLQRAASNAYSWWWASNIRTKQSKWLDNDLQEMEGRVKATIKLIDEDADSFAKKAEMYFKRRPELINSVEEAYRAYKALADRYDRISRELHKANHTIATALPDHVPLNYEDDDDDTSPKSVSSILSNISSIDASKFPKPPPELPRLSSKNKKPEAPKNPMPQHKRSPSTNLTQENAKQEIDRLQKNILVLQTEKEFFKSSYERSSAKYWEIEREMNDMQEEISTLQDEFNTGSVIEDDEARALMAASVLKSCEDTLVSLHEQQKRSLGEANLESRRIHEARCKLKALKGEDADIDGSVSSNITTMEEEVENLRHERLELQSVCDKVKEMFSMNSESSVAELAEKIDELVDKVIGLEVTVSSQTSQVTSLKQETDDLHKHLEDVEEDKKNHNVDPNNLNERLNQVELQLQRILELEKKVHDEKGVVKSHFAEACNSLNDLSDKIQSPIENVSKSSEGLKALANEENKVDMMESVDEMHNAEGKQKTEGEDKNLSYEGKQKTEGEDKNLSYDYTSIIQNFEETKKRLTEMEKKNEECHSETMQQIQELRCANAVKDEEIKALRKKLFSAKSLHNTSIKNPGDAQKLEDLMVESDEAETDILNYITEELITDPSPLDEKFRGKLDALLEENLDFWLRFSTSYHQIQKFQTTFKELKAEAEKEHEIVDSSSNNNEKSTSMPSDKKLREFNTELQVWLEHNGLLQGELRSRFSSLCNIQDEITKYTKSNEKEEAKLKFTPYQAAKFQGEVRNMQQENNKVAKELQAGLDHVKGLQSEVEKILSKLQEKFELSDSKSHTPQYNQFRHFSTRSRVPLKTFLFATKPKKPSIFACMNPVNHRHHIDNIKNMKMPSNKTSH